MKKCVLLAFRSQPDNRRSHFSRRACKLLSYSDLLGIYISGHGRRETLVQHRICLVRTTGVSPCLCGSTPELCPSRTTQCACSAAKRPRATSPPHTLSAPPAGRCDTAPHAALLATPTPRSRDLNGHWRTSHSVSCWPSCAACTAASSQPWRDASGTAT